MTGKKNLIVAFGIGATRLDQNPVRQPPHAFHRAIQVDALPERRSKLFNITRGAAAYRAPLRAFVDGQHAVVVKELHEIPRRKRQHARRIGGPDRRTHRYQVVVDELRRILAGGKIITQTNFVRGLQQLRRYMVKAQNIANHAMKRRPQQIAPLCEQGVQRGAVVFQAASLVTHAETHGRWLRLNPQFVQQRDKVWIRPVVVNDKSGVDGVTLAIEFNRVRMGVPADVAGGLEHGDVVRGVQMMCDDIAGDAAADDGDFHCGALCLRACSITVGTSFRSQMMPSAASSRRP